MGQRQMLEQIAPHARPEIEIADHDIGARTCDFGEGAVEVVDYAHVVVMRQDVAYAVSGILVIVDDENVESSGWKVYFHGASSLAVASRCDMRAMLRTQKRPRHSSVLAI